MRGHVAEADNEVSDRHTTGRFAYRQGMREVDRDGRDTRSTSRAVDGRDVPAFWSARPLGLKPRQRTGQIVWRGWRDDELTEAAAKGRENHIAAGLRRGADGYQTLTLPQ